MCPCSSSELADCVCKRRHQNAECSTSFLVESQSLNVGGGVAQFRFYAKAFTFLFKAKQMCFYPIKKQMDASGRQNLLSKEKHWSKTVA